MKFAPIDDPTMAQLFRDEVVQRRLSEIAVPLGVAGCWTRVFVAVLSAALIGAARGPTRAIDSKAAVNGLAVIAQLYRCARVNFSWIRCHRCESSGVQLRCAGAACRIS